MPEEQAQPAQMCRWCGMNHGTARCPEVAAIEWGIGPDLKPYIRRIEYWPPTQGQLEKIANGGQGEQADYPRARPGSIPS